MEMLATSSQPPPGPLAPALPYLASPGTAVHITPHPSSSGTLPAADVPPLLCPWACMPAPLSKTLPVSPTPTGWHARVRGRQVRRCLRAEGADRKAACLLMPRSFPQSPTDATHPDKDTRGVPVTQGSPDDTHTPPP